MKKMTITLIVIILVLAGGLGYVLLNQETDKTNLIDNQLIVNNFQYSYNGMVSHICPGYEESFEFSYKNSQIIITAQEKNFNGGLGQEKEDYPNCVNKGLLVNYFEYSKPFEGIPNGCELYEHESGMYNNPEFVSIKCNLKITFNILDMNKFNSCLSEETCNLINGVDVELQ